MNCLSVGLPVRKFMKIIVLLCVLGFVTGGCAVVSEPLRVESPTFVPRTDKLEEVVLSTAGPAGQTFQGHLLIDGVRQDIRAVSPAEFLLKGNIIIGELQKMGGSGTLNFSIKSVEVERSVGFGGLKSIGSGCRFGYHDGGIEVVTR